MIAIIDYNIGNITSVSNMLKRIGAECEITNQDDVIQRADKIILPGNGSFDSCMGNLRQTGLIPGLEDRVLNDGVPLLGICVGAQMLGQYSEEGMEKGLGWLDMSVHRFPELPGVKIPHMGWNHVQKQSKGHPMLEEMNDIARFYFVHSFYMKAENASDVLLTTHYGIDFVSAVSRSNISGVQFHPEKSHKFGKQLLATFAGVNLN